MSITKILCMGSLPRLLSAARMRSVLAFFASLCLALGLASSAQAQSESGDDASQVTLSVVREEGAESCPDTEVLTEHVARLRGQQATGASSAYRVTFSRKDGVFRAAIRMGSTGGMRVLRDRGQTCASLEQATALTLALLLDSDAHELEVEDHPQESEPAEERAPPALPPTLNLDRPIPPPKKPDTVRIALSFGGAGLFGVVQTAAPVALADVALFVNRFHTSLGALWMPRQKLDLGPGQLRETLFAGAARTCYAPLSARELRLDLCTGVYVGMLRVEARGYTRNDSVQRAWLAIPVEFSFSTSSTPVGVELGASALFPLRQSDFSIDNVGTAYESWPVGMLLSLRAVGSWLL